jgi:putative thioredoxin
MTVIDVSDATFEAEVLERSTQTPVVVDLWAPWCGPCKTLGPILERVIGETGGQVVLAKINVDDNPGASQAFRVQGIPAVYAVANRAIVNGFVGAQGEAAVRDFVAALLPTEEENVIAQLVASGDEESLREALELDPDNGEVITALAEVLVNAGRAEEGLAMLAKIPDTPDTRRIAAMARLGDAVPADGVEAKLDGLLAQVKTDEAARQEYLDLLELLGPEDPRTGQYRRALAARLF